MSTNVSKCLKLEFHDNPNGGSPEPAPASRLVKVVSFGDRILILREICNQLFQGSSETSTYDPCDRALKYSSMAWS